MGQKDGARLYNRAKLSEGTWMTRQVEMLSRDRMGRVFGASGEWTTLSEWRERQVMEKREARDNIGDVVKRGYYYYATRRCKR